MVPLFLAAIAAHAADPVAVVKISAERAPVAEWASRMVMTYLPDGTLNGCQLEASGAAKQPVGQAADCMSDASSGPSSGHIGEVPDAVTRLIFEQRFVPALITDAEFDPPPGNELVSRQLLSVEIGPDGEVTECRPGPAVGVRPSAQAQACDLFVGKFEPPMNKAGQRSALTGTLILSLYMREEAVT